MVTWSPELRKVFWVTMAKQDSTKRSIAQTGMVCDGVLTQDTNSRLRGHLEVSGHHILYGKTSAFFLP